MPFSRYTHGHSAEQIYPQSVTPNPLGKGKVWDASIVGFNSSPPRVPPFALPSVDDACRNTADLWPERIAPSYWVAPWPPERNPPVSLRLGADSAHQLGELVVKLIGWVIDPLPIDLTVEEDTPSFMPPPGTMVAPDQFPMDLSLLIGEETKYSMYVHPAPFQVRPLC
jgi:hypothetical protein